VPQSGQSNCVFASPTVRKHDDIDAIFALPGAPRMGLIGAAGSSVLVELPGRRASMPDPGQGEATDEWRDQASWRGFYKRPRPALQRQVGIDCDMRMAGPARVSLVAASNGRACRQV